MVDKIKDITFAIRVLLIVKQIWDDIFEYVEKHYKDYGFKRKSDATRKAIFEVCTYKLKSIMFQDVDVEKLNDIGVEKITDVEVISSEDKKKLEEYERSKDYLESNCDRSLLEYIGGIPMCGKRAKLGIGAIEPFIYPEDHIRSGELMSVVDIEGVCKLCKQEFSEDKRLKELMKAVEVASGEREKDLYACTNPNVLNNIQLSLNVNTKFLCPDDGRNVTIKKTCMKRHCPSLEIVKIIIPPSTEMGTID